MLHVLFIWRVSANRLVSELVCQLRNVQFSFAHPYFLVRRLVTFLAKKRNQFVDRQITAAIRVRFAKERFEFARHFLSELPADV